VRAVDHRFALSRPALLSAPLKIVLQRQLSDLRMQRLRIDGRLRGSGATTGTENIGNRPRAALSTM
jgi:hypothetical protein